MNLLKFFFKIANRIQIGFLRVARSLRRVQLEWNGALQISCKKKNNEEVQNNVLPADNRSPLQWNYDETCQNNAGAWEALKWNISVHCLYLMWSFVCNQCSYTRLAGAWSLWKITLYGSSTFHTLNRCGCSNWQAGKDWVTISQSCHVPARACARCVGGPQNQLQSPK